MKQIALTAALALALALPVQADDTTLDNETGAGTESGGGFNLIEEGARLLFKGLVQEMEPALKDMEELTGQLEPALRGLVENMGPALGEFLGQVEDFSNYHPPEILPNGDILLRRKSDADLAAPEGEIDL